MADKKPIDVFSNIATISIVESAANTITFKKLETGIPLFEKVAWVISRLELMFNPLAAAMVADADAVLFALTVSNTIASLASGKTQTEPAVLYGGRIIRNDFGAAATGYLSYQPYILDFSTMPGGGLLTPPSPLYGAVEGASMQAAITLYMRLYYTQIQLTPDQYWELVEARRYIQS